jgi:hypothetical protein
MKRAGIQRKTPMHRGGQGLKASGGLKRATPLKAGDKPLARKTELPKVNKARQARKTAAAGMTRTKAKDIVRARSGLLCEFRFPGVCLGRGTNIAHIKPEGQGGLYVPSNLIMSCGFGNNHGGCHGWQENNRAEAYENGWLVRSRADHREQPIRMWYRGEQGVWLLDDKGTAVPAETNSGEAA